MVTPVINGLLFMNIQEQEPLQNHGNEAIQQEHNGGEIITPESYVREQEPLHTHEDESCQQEHHLEDINTLVLLVHEQESLETHENNPLQQELIGEETTTRGTHVQQQEYPHIMGTESLPEAKDDCNIDDVGETEGVQVELDDHGVECQEPNISVRENSHTDIGTFGATSPQAGCSSWTGNSQEYISETNDISYLSLKAGQGKFDKQKFNKLKTIKDLQEQTNAGTICNEGMNLTFTEHHFKDDQLVFAKVLGKGANGEVKEYRDKKTKKRFARKIVKYEQFRKEEVCGQIAARSMNSLVPEILQVSMQNNDVRIDMELLPDNSRTLSDVIRRCFYHPSFDLLWLYVLERGLFLLSRLHEAGYMHNDLNSGNVMVTIAGDNVLIDFGSAKRINYSTDNDYQNMTEVHEGNECASMNNDSSDSDNQHRVVVDDFRDFTNMMTDGLQEQVNIPFYLDTIIDVAVLNGPEGTTHEHYRNVHEMCNNNNIDREQIKRILGEIVASLYITYETKFPP